MSVEEEEVKAKYRNRPDLKEKTNCPDCGNELTIYGLKCTHKRYCKANQPKLPWLETPAPMPNLERIVATEPITSLVPTDEQIAAFILNPRKLKANEKRANMSSLVSRALPK